MRYVVKIDTDTEQGATAIKMLKALKAPAQAISFETSQDTAFRELTDEDMALPGLKPTKAEFEAWLDRPGTDKSYPLNEASQLISQNLMKPRG